MKPLERALRDIRDGHISIYTRPDGRISVDRQVAGAPEEWWLELEEAGLIRRPKDGQPGRWLPASLG